MVNLLFIDSTIPSVSTFLDGINSNTKFIVYDYTDSFESINQKILNLNTNTFENVGFVFADENTELKLFVSYNTFMSYDNNGMKENNTTLFIKNLVSTYSVQKIDFLACNLLSYPKWKEYFEYLMLDNSGLIVRASSNKSGNLKIGADWILESTNEDVTNVYFNDDINNWNHILDLCSGSIFLIDNNNELNVCGQNYSGEHSTGKSMFNNNLFTAGIDNFNDVVDVATGMAHTIIVRSNGSVWACGDNSTNYALGVGSTSVTQSPNFIECKYSSTGNSTGLTSFTNAIKVECGDYTSAVITSTNKLYLCGQNNNCQLGISTTDTINRQSFIEKTISGVTDITDVKLGSNHVIAICDGTLYSWGLNDNGQLGRNITVVAGTKYSHGICKFSDNSNVTNVTKIAAGANHNLCVSNGILYASGSNGNGQLGANVAVTTSNINYFTNTKLADDSASLPSIVDIINPLDISAGETHSAVVTSDKQLRTCGNHSSFGQTGQGAVSGNCLYFRRARMSYTNPTAVYISNAISVKCGRTHTLYKNENGEILACGRNSNGQLGTGNFTSTTTTNPYFFNCKYSTNNGISSSGNLINVNKIVMGSRSTHTIVLTNNNEILFCGTNANGNNNSGHLNSYITTNKVFQKVKKSDGTNMDDVLLVSYGGNTLVGVSYIVKKTDGKLLASGNNQYGQLGSPNTDGSLESKLTYVQCYSSTNGTTSVGLAEMKDVISVACTDSFVLALKKDGTLWACGYNNKGQLGDNTIANKKYFVQCKYKYTDSNGITQYANITDARAISCGTGHSLIIRNVSGSENSVWACGDNTNGRLGNGNETIGGFSADELAFVQCIDSNNNYFTNAIDVKCGAQYSLVLTSDKNVYGCGNNSSYQLGDTFAYRIKFQLFNSTLYNNNLLNRVTSIACGNSHTLFLRDDGTVWGVGANTSGQLAANGSTTNPLSGISQLWKTTANGGKITNAKFISAFTHSTVVIDTNNKVWVSGDNVTGKFGIKNAATGSEYYLQDPAASYTSAELQESNNSVLNMRTNILSTGKRNLTVSAPNQDNLSVINNLSNTTAYFKDNTKTQLSIKKYNNTYNTTDFNSLYTSLGLNTKFVDKKETYQLLPAGTIFDNYINFDMTFDSTNGIVIYFKSETDTEPVKLYEDDRNNYGAYYQIINSTTVRIYTKHFSYVSGGTQEICLLKGTTVLTSEGYKLIEDLKINDLVITNDNRLVPIKYIHCRDYTLLNKQNMIPYKIEKNSIAENYPSEDTYMSGYHMIYYNGNWIQPNKCTVFKQDKTIKDIIYYNIELENYETDNLVINGGLVVESLGNGTLHNSNIWCNRSQNSIIIE